MATSTGTLAPLPSLPLDLVAEILCQLPVKHLIQLRCVCKSWNSLISEDSNFAKKHLHLSTYNHDRHHLNILSKNSSYELHLLDYPISSIFSSMLTTAAMQLWCPPMDAWKFDCVTTCDGMLCFRVDYSLALLCNPSIRKFKMLPPLTFPKKIYIPTFTLMYDRFTHNYKIIALLVNFKNITEVEVNIHTLGTDYWTKIQDLPYDDKLSRPGIFVSDTVNWLMNEPHSAREAIVYFDLEKESFQTLWNPLQDVEFNVYNTLGVVRDCLCIVSHLHGHNFSDVWIMKEYGNDQSWIQLMSISHKERGFYYESNQLYISKDDDQVMLEFLQEEGLKKSLLIYDFVNKTSKIPQIQNINNFITSKIYVESLISPLF